MSVAEAVQATSKASSSSSSGFVLQRKCACGGSAGFTGECEECRRGKFLGKALQRKLAINEPGDEYEREADRVAEQVMRIAEPARRSGGAESPASSLVQGRVSGAGTGGVGTAPPLVRELLTSPGQPPDASARAFLEPRFGRSLHDVRLHTDGRAQQAAKSVHARAFTVGRHIVFGAGEYVPRSTTSTLLLAHELTHVVQQTGGASVRSNAGSTQGSTPVTVTSHHGTPVLARKSSAVLSRSGTALDQPVAEQVAGDQIESAVKVTGANSRGDLARLGIALADEQRAKESEDVPVEQVRLTQTEPPGLIELSETSGTVEAAAGPQAFTARPEGFQSPAVSRSELAAASTAAGIQIGTPSETGRQFNALPPSIQAESYAQLGAALSVSFANQAFETQNAIPELSASLEGVTELPATPVVATPPLTPSVAGQALARTPEPVVKIPQAPALPPVSQRALPTAQATEPKALDQALGAIDQAPAFATTLKIPDIPLEGKADPAALGTLESAATGEAARSLDAAQAGVMDVSPEIVQALELDEVVAVPALTGAPLPERTPQVEGMDKLAGYALGPRDRDIVDAQVGPSMQEAATGVQLELDQRQQAFDQERTRLHLEADSEAAAAQARAEEDQRLEVEQGREDLAAEQDRTLAQQQAAVDGALGELAMSRDASRREIDDRLAADRATVDGIYRAAEVDVQAEVEKGRADADAAKRATADKVQASSWWDWAIDTWQGFVQWFAANLVAIWERVNGIVAGLFDQAIQLATGVVHGAVAFVKGAISAYYDLWIGLVDKLLGNIFPELAAAFRTAVEGLKAKVFEALDAVAAGYLQALRVVADALIAGLDAGMQAYKTGVAAYLALWEAIQQGQWGEVGRTVLTAILTAAGIDPEEFFATFTKFDEVVDDVIADPGLAGRNAVKALGLGFTQFGTNFIGNFTAAFVEWITGAAAIRLPETFSIAGIFDVVCQVLNLTKAYLEKKAIQHLGQGAVTAVKELTEAAWAFVSGGWGGLWNLVKDKLTTLVDDVVVAMGTWLVEKAILVVGRWIVGLAATMGISVIFEALVALWQFVMWLKDQFQRFWMIVKSTVDSVHEFVKGKIEPAADKIEGTLQDLIVPAIDLVAKLLNISNIAKKVEQIIEAVRGLIDRAIDSVINGIKKTLGFGKKKPAERHTAEEEDGRDGKITLATLKEPPVTLPRTKEEESEDLKAAHKVLELAAINVHDTAQFAEYFEPVQRRFRLKHLGYVDIGDQQAVQAQINPAMNNYYRLNSRDEELSGIGLHAHTTIESKTARISLPGSAGGGSDEVAVEMVAKPVGPDHRQGEGPRQSALKKIMARLETTPTNDENKKYIKGHLLNDNVGGPGTPDNLYPITADANRKHEALMEQWVKEEVRKGYYVYYKVNVTERNIKLDGSNRQNFIHSTIRAEAGYWKTTADPSGHHWDQSGLRQITVHSIAAIGGNAEIRASSMGGERETTTEELVEPIRQPNDTPKQLGVVSPESKRKADKYSFVKEGEEAVDSIQGYLDLLSRVEGLSDDTPTSVRRARAGILSQKDGAARHNADALQFVQQAKLEESAGRDERAIQEIINAEASIGLAVDAASEAQSILTGVVAESVRLLSTSVEEKYDSLARESVAKGTEISALAEPALASAAKLADDYKTNSKLLQEKLSEKGWWELGREEQRRSAKTNLTLAKNEAEEAAILTEYESSKTSTLVALGALRGPEGTIEVERVKSAVSAFDELSEAIDKRRRELDKHLQNVRQAQTTLDRLLREIDYLVAY